MKLEVQKKDLDNVEGQVEAVDYFYRNMNDLPSAVVGELKNNIVEIKHQKIIEVPSQQKPDEFHLNLAEYYATMSKSLCVVPKEGENRKEIKKQNASNVIRWLQQEGSPFLIPVSSTFDPKKITDVILYCLAHTFTLLNANKKFEDRKKVFQMMKIFLGMDLLSKDELNKFKKELFEPAKSFHFEIYSKKREGGERLAELLQSVSGTSGVLSPRKNSPVFSSLDEMDVAGEGRLPKNQETEEQKFWEELTQLIDNLPKKRDEKLLSEKIGGHLRMGRK